MNKRGLGLMQRIKRFMLNRMHTMITCKEFEDFILSYLEGELPEWNVFKFELHLRVCRECRDYLAAYKQAAELGISILPSPNDPVPKDVPEELIKAILDAKSFKE